MSGPQVKTRSAAALKSPARTGVQGLGLPIPAPACRRGWRCAVRRCRCRPGTRRRRPRAWRRGWRCSCRRSARSCRLRSRCLRRAPRPSGAAKSARSRAALQQSAPATSTAASTPRALATQCLPADVDAKGELAAEDLRRHRAAVAFQLAVDEPGLGVVVAAEAEDPASTPAAPPCLAGSERGRGRG